MSETKATHLIEGVKEIFIVGLAPSQSFKTKQFWFSRCVVVRALVATDNEQAPTWIFPFCNEVVRVLTQFVWILGQY